MRLMKPKLLLLFFLLSSALTYSQTPTICAFERLFTFKPGMDKPSVISLVQQDYEIAITNTTSERLKPYASTGGDSILRESVTYRIDSSVCLKGRNSSLQFEFADNKLFKAYLVTTYSLNEYPELMTNFKFLHDNIKRSWKHEKEITLKSETTEGFGYNFYKTLDKNAKIETCSLQYVKLKSKTPGQDKYQLEIVWANLNNTRMENSMY